VVRELVQIGNAVLSAGTDQVLEALIAPLERVGEPPKGQQHLLAIIDVKSTPPGLEVRTEALDGNRARRYLWVGNPRANDPKVRVTTNRLDYLLGQTFYAICQDKGAPAEIRERLARVYPRLFCRDQKARGGNRKYSYVLNAKGLGLVDAETWNQLCELDPKKRASGLAEALLTRLDLPKRGVLYTLAIEGEPLALLPAYRSYLLQKIVDEAFKKVQSRICHGCGKKGPVTGNFKHFQIKFFINDKVNFAYGLDKTNWPKNYGLCRDCYMAALAGERYLERHLGTRILQTDTLMVPALGPAPLTHRSLDALSEKLREATSSLEKVERLPALLNQLGAASALPQISLLFIERSQSATKVREAVPEVEPSWVMDLLKAFGRTNQRARALFGPPPWGGHGEWLLGMVALLYLLPLGVKKGQPEVGSALSAFKSLLLKEPQGSSTWVRRFLTVARFIHRKNPGLYVSKNCPDGCPDVEAVLPQMAAWLLFLRETGLWKEANRMEIATVEGTHQETVRALALDQEQAALFLLGVLLARVASEQYKRSKSKPVLEKVGFQGMPIEKVRRFAVELFDKLGEYRRLDADSEATFAAAMELLASGERDWRLSDEENAFYILLGYGLETRRILNLGAAKAAKGEEA